MARRLFIVLSQSPTSGPMRRQLEEDLITQLIMEAGFEVNVVPHLADLPSEATGMLCLEGISGNMVLLSWLPDAEAWSHLQRYGIQGRRGITKFADLEQEVAISATSGNRAIYLLNLTRHESAEALLSEIRRIRDDQAVQTVPIIGLGTSPLPLVNSPGPSSAPTQSATSATVSGSASASSSAAASPSPHPVVPSTPKPGQPARQTSPTSSPAMQLEADQDQEEERREAELDRLVDQLDELDI